MRNFHAFEVMGRTNEARFHVDKKNIFSGVDP